MRRPIRESQSTQRMPLGMLPASYNKGKHLASSLLSMTTLMPRISQSLNTSHESGFQQASISWDSGLTPGNSRLLLCLQLHADPCLPPFSHPWLLSVGAYAFLLLSLGFLQKSFLPMMTLTSTTKDLYHQSLCSGISLLSFPVSLVPVLIIPTASFLVLVLHSFIIYLFYFLVVVLAQYKHSKHCLMNQSTI